MSDAPFTSDAALFAFGLLLPEAARRLEEELGRDEVLAADVRAFAQTAAALAEMLPAPPPPEGLRARVLERAHAAPFAQASPALGAILAEQGKWKPGPARGITYKRLYYDEQADLVTLLVRLEPGAVYPSHVHHRTEQCLVIEGDLIHDDHVYRPGDFTWAKPGSVDPTLTTEGGALLLLITAPERRPQP